jgi:hypothetical protein
MKDTGPAEGQYVYAIIACAEPREFPARGIGERGDAVHLVNYRRLGAIVSSSPNIEYENSRRNMMAHTLVLEEIMKEFDLLPVRFRHDCAGCGHDQGAAPRDTLPGAH